MFATTIGHYNETMVQPEYLDMLTRGLLWAVGKDVEKSFRSTDEATNKAIFALATAPVAGSGGAPVLAGKCFSVCSANSLGEEGSEGFAF